ncbi:ammonia monooxygenase [Salmonella enterica]|uniref:ammonia monooxygenase n=1 Tax=Citrobacter braakii TaxID=57706 RepID=UPI002894FDF6|nr:ammonia monooxygenase [Citrobacter braakii]ELH9297402.1 ammonia monooxygenase [Salmonella enterica]MEB2307334.1 ammonia monooxygenase [Citrobacter braakii]
MNTQNVNVKTATKESSERWGANPKTRLACVIAEQRSYLNELCQVWNLQLSQKDEAEEVLRLLSLMSDNVHKEGVLCWERSYPLVSFHVVQPWLQAKNHAIRLYGMIGREAWEIARKDLRDNINFAQAMLEVEVC